MDIEQRGTWSLIESRRLGGRDGVADNVLFDSNRRTAQKQRRTHAPGTICSRHLQKKQIQNIVRNRSGNIPFHPVSKVMNTETIKLNVAVLSGRNTLTQPSASAFDGNATVAKLVVEAVTETCRKMPAQLILPRTAGAVSAEWLLRVLTCSYAKGVTASEDIERKLHAESPSPKNLPDADTLCRFRRLNRAPLETALENVLRAMWLRQVRTAQPNPSASAGIGAETAIHLHHEATARIEETVLRDHAAVGE